MNGTEKDLRDALAEAKDRGNGYLELTIAGALEITRELDGLRALCRRAAEHLNNECHTGIKDIETHRALAAELERAGWDEGGKER